MNKSTNHHMSFLTISTWAQATTASVSNQSTHCNSILFLFYSQNCQHLKIIVGIIVTYKAWHGIIVTYKKIIILIENRVISYMSFGDNNDGFLTSHLRQLKCIIYDPNNLFQNFIGYSIYLMFLIIFFGNNKKKQTVHAYTRKCLILGNFYVCKYFFL